MSLHIYFTQTSPNFVTIDFQHSIRNSAESYDSYLLWGRKWRAQAVFMGCPGREFIFCPIINIFPAFLTVCNICNAVGSECLRRIRIDLKNNYNLYLKNIISVVEDLPMLLRKKEPIFLKWLTMRSVFALLMTTGLE